MTGNRHWLLPEGIDEVLPPEAAQLDALCRRILDLFATWGYEFVIPPLVEYLESLLTGTGEDLDLATFKVTDQLSGRMMGIRADLTPQVARVDAHYLRRETPTRLCYLGPVLLTRPDVPGGSRVPLQAGAELYGHAGPEGDAEIIVLMLKTLQAAGIQQPHVDLGHVGIFRNLVTGLALDADREHVLFDALQRKATAGIRDSLADWSLDGNWAEALLRLPDLHGGAEVLDEARTVLGPLHPAFIECLDNLARIAELVRHQVREAPLFFDLAELRGYHYHTGTMFSTYVAGAGQAIAKGGRYDAIGAAFGRLRPATGFSADIRQLFELAEYEAPVRHGIFAPCSELPGLRELVNSLRAGGETVVVELPGQQGDAAAMGCDRRITLEHGRWVVSRLDDN